MLTTGTLNGNGLFYGKNTTSTAVKIFGMENWWGNQGRRYAGHASNNRVQLYKLTRGRQDGSSCDDYVQTTTATDYNGYLVGATCPSSNGLIKYMQFLKSAFQVTTSGGSTSTYYCDNISQATGLRYAFRGGNAGATSSYSGTFNVSLGEIGSTTWNVGAALSCKPLAQVNS